MKSLKEVLLKSTEYLQTKQVPRARLRAEEAIADALEVKRIDLYLQFDRPLNESELDQCRCYIQRCGTGEPIQYIRGYTTFADCHIEVNMDVLIPRQETEILVSQIVQELESKPLEGKKLWDVCCGSGCIGIALKKKFPQLEVTLSDLSPKALEIAKKNALKNNVEVSFVEGDLFQPFNELKTDYLVCNPPYVSLPEYEVLDRGVKDYEPKLALVGGADGLEFYRRLARELPQRLNPNGKAWFEIGHKQAETAAILFSGYTRIEKDWAGHDRFLHCSPLFT